MRRSSAGGGRARDGVDRFFQPETIVVPRRLYIFINNIDGQKVQKHSSSWFSRTQWDFFACGERGGWSDFVKGGRGEPRCDVACGVVSRVNMGQIVCQQSRGFTSVGGNGK